MARIFGMGFFGVKLWSRDFLGALSFAPFDHPCHVKSRVPPPLGMECWPSGVFLGIIGGGVLPGSPNPEKPYFPHRFSHLASKIYSLFQTWPPRNYVIIT